MSTSLCRTLYPPHAAGQRPASHMQHMVWCVSGCVGSELITADLTIAVQPKRRWMRESTSHRLCPGMDNGRDDVEAWIILMYFHVCMCFGLVLVKHEPKNVALPMQFRVKNSICVCNMWRLRPSKRSITALINCLATAFHYNPFKNYL